MPPIAEHESDLAGQGYQIYQISSTVRVSCPQIPAGYTALTPPPPRDALASAYCLRNHSVWSGGTEMHQ